MALGEVSKNSNQKPKIPHKKLGSKHSALPVELVTTSKEALEC